MTIIEAINIFLNIISNYKYTRVFKLLVYLGTGAYIVVLFKVLHTCNLLLLRLSSYLITVAIYRVSVEFLFRLSRNFKGGRVDINN